MTCGRTKAKALCENIIGPYSVQLHTDYIKENNLPFSVATNAKPSVFPLCHVLKVFSDTIEALEAKSFSITSVFRDPRLNFSSRSAALVGTSHLLRYVVVNWSTGRNGQTDAAYGLTYMRETPCIRSEGMLSSPLITALLGKFNTQL
ncbi:uncharacterized protein LOC117248027 [Scomber scombrus]|uniref:Uncharacterized protein LOC117248027 n=1 Tax=Scomber scombrus TaxID=13677 RepID=A0AAV1Q297_SCOSC